MRPKQTQPGQRPWQRRSEWRGQIIAPIVLSVDANADRVAGGSTVTITGQYFGTGLGTVSVTFGGVASSSVIVNSDSSLSVVVPEASGDTPGLVDIVVTVGTLSGTLAGAFLYYAGSIASVSPNYALVGGGLIARIFGTNFLAGSSIAFGSADVSPSNIIFVDATQFVVTVPTSEDGAGPVDITITEPSGVTVVGRALFVYSGILPTADIRRLPQVTIQDNLNNNPNTCEFVVDGRSAPPKVGTRVQFTDGETLIFNGSVEEHTLFYEGEDFDRLAYRVHAIDDTPRLNALRPFGTWDNQSVTDIVLEIIQNYAPWVDTSYVQTNLARVSLQLDGSQDIVTIFSALANALGEGHWKLDYRSRLHLFHKKGLNVPPVRLPTSPLQLGPGTAMTVTESSTLITGSFEPGWYYFKSTSKYGGSSSFGSPSVGTPTNYVLLSNEAAALCITGNVSNGRYSPDGVTIFPRGWAGWAGTSYVPDGQWASYPPGGSTVYFASADVAGVLEAQATFQFESAYSPISNAIYLSTKRPTFSGIPIAPTAGIYAAASRRIFFVRYSDISGPAGGGTRTTGYIMVGDNVTTTLTSEPTVFYDGPPVISAQVAAGPALGCLLLESATQVSDGYEFQAGYHAIMISGVYEDGTESYASPASNTCYLSGQYQPTIRNVPTMPTVNGVPCIFRLVFLSVFQPAPDQGDPDFYPGHTRLAFVITDNTSDSATFDPHTMSGGDRSPDYPVGVPLGIVTTTSHVDGPWLEDAEKPTDLIDGEPTLYLDPPVQYSEDRSQLRNRIIVKGKGTTLVADASAGTQAIRVSDASMFLDSGGTLIVGSRVLAYQSRDIASTPQSLTLAAPLDLPLLQSSWLYGGGLPIRPYVVVEDVKSQHALGLIELDVNGNPTSGIHEYTIDDNSLATTEQCIAAGLADLQKFAWPIKKLAYDSWDSLTGSGKIITANLQHPPVVGDFLIQNVTITLDDSAAQRPRYRVQADSSARLNYLDYLLYLDDRASKASLSAISLTGGNGGSSGGGRSMTGAQRQWFNVFLNDASGGGVDWDGCIVQSVLTGNITLLRETTSVNGMSMRMWARGSPAGGGFHHGMTVDVSAAEGWTYWEWEPFFETLVRTGNNLDPRLVYWVALNCDSALPNNSATYTGRHVGIVCDGRGGWCGSSGTGTQQTITTPLGAILPNTLYHMSIQWKNMSLAALTIDDLTNGQTYAVDMPVANLVATAATGGFRGARSHVVMTSPNTTIAGATWDVAGCYGERN